jgi:tetratricopeptide (TPR) repeat protein
MRSSRFPLHFRISKRWIARGVVVIGLVGLTAWRATRPQALAEAEVAYANSDLVTALRRASDQLDCWSPSPRAARVAALSLSRLDFALESEPYYYRAAPLNLTDLHHRAFGLVRGNCRERAILAYQEILSRRPDDVLALRRQAAVLMTQVRRNDALRLAERLVKIPQGEVIGYTLVGILNHELGEPELAVAAFERVLALDADLRTMPLKPPDRFWNNLGTDLIALGRYADARLYLSRAIAREDNATLVSLMGEAFYRDSMLEEAEQCWQKALERDPDLPIVWLHLGRLALTRGRLQEAVQLLERAARLAPGAYQPLYSLSLAHGRLGRRVEAEQYRREADLIRKRSAAPRGSAVAQPIPPSLRETGT